MGVGPDKLHMGLLVEKLLGREDMAGKVDRVADRLDMAADMDVHKGKD